MVSVHPAGAPALLLIRTFVRLEAIDRPMPVLDTYVSFTRRHGLPAAATVTRYYFLRLLAALSGPGRACSCCGWEGKDFQPRLNDWDASLLPRDLCPRCKSFPRHRAYALFYERFFRSESIARSCVMHFAAEDCFNYFMPSKCKRYDRSSFDSPGRESYSLDLEGLALADSAYDVFMMHHVICCVRDDRRAVSELYRTLRPGGIVLAAEKVRSGQPTLEYSERQYGGTCRMYGETDLATRFAPFSVELRDPLEGTNLKERERFGANPLGGMLVLRKARG